MTLEYGASIFTDFGIQLQFFHPDFRSFELKTDELLLRIDFKSASRSVKTKAP